MLLKRWLLILCVLFVGQFPISAQTDCSDLSSAEEYAARADTAFDQKLYEDAVLDYTCAIQLAPDTPDYYNSRGNAHYWLQRDADANADYQQVLALDPDAGYVYNNIANLYANIGDYPQAVEYYTKALSLESATDEIVFTNRASIYIDMGEYDLAQDDLLAALSLNSSYNRQYLIQGYLDSLLNRTESAAQNYIGWISLTQIVDSYPQYVPNRSYVTRLTDGDVQYIYLSFNAGDTLSASAELINSDQRVDPLLVLLSPGGQALIADDDSGVNTDAVIADFVIPENGEYQLVLGNSGGYYYEGVDGQVRLSIMVKRAEGTVVVEPTPDTSSGAEVESEDVTATFSTFRLFAGVTAEIYTTEGDRLNLRSGPGLRFDIVTKLDKGARVTLLEGPRKQDGLAWWKIRTADGTEGWAVERVDEEQTLQMALITGEDALVATGDETLNVRTGAGRSNSILVQLGDGERVTVLEVSPGLIDGFQWWKVRLADGREGWTVDRIEGERTLIPAKEYEAGGG